MITLAFNTLSENISLAITQDDEILAKTTIDESSKHSELLIVAIEEVLNQANIWYQDLDLVATITTPGSFTASRISLVTAKVIKLSLDIPVANLDGCEVLAYKNSQKYSGNLIIAMKGTQIEYYLAIYKLENAKISVIKPPKSYHIDDLDDFIIENNQLPSPIICGSAKEKIINKKLFKSYFESEIDEIEAFDISKLAIVKNREGKLIDDIDISYLRQPRIKKRTK